MAAAPISMSAPPSPDGSAVPSASESHGTSSCFTSASGSFTGDAARDTVSYPDSSESQSDRQGISGHCWQDSGNKQLNAGSSCGNDAVSADR
jgi:hypothetical protein